MTKPRILLISGHICVGKSRLANGLNQKFNFQVAKTHELLKRKACDIGGGVDRVTLQKLGEWLDSETEGEWVADGVAERIAAATNAHQDVVVDSVRILSQVDAFRRKYGQNVTHVHLIASADTRRSRFQDRKTTGHDVDQDTAYDETLSNTTEALVDSLQTDADLVINVDDTDHEDTLVRVASRLRLYAAPQKRCVDVLVGGQYGSEGKGQVAAYLADNYDVVIRVGGPNAGHKVRSRSGEFTYHHLPSGCKDNDAVIVLGPGAVIDPEKLVEEIRAAELVPERLIIDPQAMLIGSDDAVKEQQTIVDSIASTGTGTGSAAARKILMRNNPPRLARDEARLASYVYSAYEYLERAYAEGRRILLEGTQGSALSLHHGSYPHVTSRDTNVAGCLAEAGVSPARVGRIIMVIRTYPIRVGDPDQGVQTSGYLKNEIDFDKVAARAGLDADEVQAAEVTSTTGRARRVGEFDWEQFRKACALNAPTDVALTFVDYVDHSNREAQRFEQLTENTLYLIEELERVARAPVSMISTHFGARAVIDRRDWS